MAWPPPGWCWVSRPRRWPGRRFSPEASGHRITLVVGIITFGLGVATVWVETSELLLAAFMAGIAVTYALAELVHVEEPVEAPVTRGQLAHHS